MQFFHHRLVEGVQRFRPVDLHQAYIVPYFHLQFTVRHAITPILIIT